MRLWARCHPPCGLLPRLIAGLGSTAQQSVPYWLDPGPVLVFRGASVLYLPLLQWQLRDYSGVTD